MCQHSGALEQKWNRQFTRPIFQRARKMWSGNETKLLIWDCPLLLPVQVSVVPLDSSSMSCSYSLTHTPPVAPSGLLAMTTSVSHNLKYLLFYSHQRTPLDWAVIGGYGKVEAYLKRAADPETLWVSMWGCTIENSCGIEWRSTHLNRHIITAISHFGVPHRNNHWTGLSD